MSLKMIKHFYGNAYLLLVCTTLIWGGNAVAGKLAVGEVSPAVLVAFRWLGVVALIAIFARKSMRDDWPVLRQHLPFLFLLGAVGFTLFNTLFYIAAQRTEALNIGILQGAIPVFVMLGSFIFFRSVVTQLQMLGVAITIIGVIVVASRGDLQRLIQLELNSGDLIMLTACGLYATYTVALRRRPQVSGLAMFSTMSVGALVTSLPFLGYEIISGDFAWPSTKGWLIVGFVVIFPSFLSQIFFLRGVQLVGPSRAGVFVNLVPVFAAILSVLILAEVFSLFHGLALVFVLGGIALSERGKPETERG